MPDLGSLCELPGPSDELPTKDQFPLLPLPCCDHSEKNRLANGAVDVETAAPAFRGAYSVSNGSNGWVGNGGRAVGDGRRVILGKAGRNSAARSLEGHVRVWVMKKIASGVAEEECRLPFLVHAPRVVECRICGKSVASGMDMLCSVRGCGQIYHKTCVRIAVGLSAGKDFKCPQHVTSKLLYGGLRFVKPGTESCFLCKQKGYWRCLLCVVAAHSKCSPWPEAIILKKNKSARAVCWRHPSDWRLHKKECYILGVQHEDPTNDIEEVFHRLPLPYVEEEFMIDVAHIDTLNNELGPAPYVHIRRNVYLIKKKRDPADFGTGCTRCDANSSCAEDCECRVQSISCSRKCYCTEKCKNRPFRKEKKLKIVKTQFCGWGVDTAEPIKKGEFLIEYIGEVIDDALCEARLWDIKYRGDENFYMCEIRKDFIIDATFKGNASRFLNHSCDPNCKLEKWQVDGETRVGVFASRDIQVGEPLTYDYRFVHFGHYIKCCCGSSNCQGYLGSKKRVIGVV